MSNHAHDRAAQEKLSAEVFARLHEQDIEQFYAHYQLWVLRRRVPLLEKQVEVLREHIDENQQRLQSLRPSALAQAVLVRLQSSGVNNIELLDLMLERGEDWLDRMMQRLDYCEQVEDFIQGDYTQWCIRSLEGAYDWIDSLLGSVKEDGTPQEESEGEIVPTEELLLQKLSQDDEEAMRAVTLTSPAPQPESAEAGEQAMITESAAPESTPRASTVQVEEDEAAHELSPTGMAEAQESNEDVTPPELLGWKDLEDLEAPAGKPVPWYSVSVTETGASDASASEQADSMNDWITVLQADNESREHSTPEATTPLLADQPEASVTPADPAVLSKAEAEQASILMSENVLSASAAEAEVQSEEETSAVVAGLLQEQSEAASAEEASALIEVEPAEQEAEQTDQEEVPAASEQAIEALEDGAETTEEAAADYEIEAPPAKAGEAETSVVPEQGPGALQEEASEEETSLSTGQEAESAREEVSENAELLTAEEASEVLEPAEAEEMEPAASEQPEDVFLPGEDEAAGPGVVEVSAVEDLESADEQSEAIPQGDDDVILEQSQVEVNAQARDAGSENSELTDASAQAEESTSEQPVAAENELESAALLNDMLLIEDEQEEQVAWYEYMDLETPAQEMPPNLSSENALDETATLSALAASMMSESAAQAEPDLLQEAGNAISAASESDGAADYAHALEEMDASEQAAADTQADLPGESSADDIEDWQTWQAQDADDATMPMALKDIRFAQQAANESESEETSGETDALRENTDEENQALPAQEAMASQAEAAPVDDNESSQPAAFQAEASSETEAFRTDGSERDQAEIAPAAADIDPGAVREGAGEESQQGSIEEEARKSELSDAPTMQMSALVVSETEGEESTFALTTTDETSTEASTVLVNEQSVSIAYPSVPQQKQERREVTETASAQAETPEKKVGFWRRLFGFGRRKKRQ